MTGYRDEDNPSSSSPSDESSDDDEETRYTPIKVLQTTESHPISSSTSSSTNNEEKPNREVSLSDFWNIFSSSGGTRGASTTTTTNKSTTSSSTTTERGQNANDEGDGRGGTEQEVSYEEESSEQTSSNERNTGNPFNFSAPVDAPLTPTEPDEQEEEEYNIPFGEPARPTQSSPTHHRVTGRPTITKIVESDPPSFHTHQHQQNNKKQPIRGGDDEVEQVAYNEVDLTPDMTNDDEGNDRRRHPQQERPPEPLIPPVIIGDTSAEPRDWYYTNYHKTEPSKDADQVLERLLERSNKLRQDTTTVENSAASSSRFLLLRNNLTSLLSLSVLVLQRRIISG